MNLSADDVADVPPGVVTVISTVPVPAGAITVIEVSLLNVYDTDVLPNFTEVTPVKPVPVMAIEVPPAFVPFVGDMAVMTGTGGAT